MSFHDCFRLGVHHLIVLRTRTCLFVHDQSFLSARNPRARPLRLLLSSRSSIYLSRAMAIVRRLYIRPNKFIPQTRQFDPNKSWRDVDSNPGPLPHVPLDLKLTHVLDCSTILAPLLQFVVYLLYLNTWGIYFGTVALVTLTLIVLKHFVILQYF